MTTTLDPELVDEFQFVERVRTFFRTGGVTLAFWEAYCLTQNNRAALRRAADRPSGPDAAPALPEIPLELLENLRVLRDRGGPIVSKLRRLFLSRPSSPEDSELLEMALAVMVGSERGREVIGRWVTEPDRCQQEASERIQSVMKRLDPVRQRIRPTPAAPPPAELAAPPPSPTPPAPAPSADAPAPPPPVPTVEAPAAPPPAPVAMPAEILVSPPAPPADLTASPSPGRVALSWTASPKATGYNVKRSEAADGRFLTIGTATDCAYADEKASPGAVYFYAVSASSEAGEGADSPPARAAVPAPPPPQAPANLVAAPAVGKISLTWTPVPEATAYAVRRAAGPGGASAPLAQVTAPAYSDAGVTPGTAYSYVVRSINAQGESPDTAPATASPIGPPAAPTGFAVSSDNQQFYFSWGAVPGATSYTLKRSAAPGGPYAVIVSGLKQKGLDEIPPARGVPFYYVVCAVGPGGESHASAEVSKALPAPPRAPTGLSATPGHGRVSLAWTPSPGASRYQVKRRVGATSKFVTIAGTTEASHVDAAVTGGTSYEYVVSALGEGTESADSPAARAVPIAAPPAPADLKAQPGDGKVSLSWTASAGAAEYRIRRTPVKEGNFAEIARVPGATSYVDDNVVNGIAYDYVVLAANSGGISPASARARALPIPAPAAPRSLEGSAGQGRVLLTWAAAAGAATYALKRSASPEGPFVEIVTTKETTYTDTSVVNGTTYYYRVSAANGGGSSAETGPLKATPVDQPAAPLGLTLSPGPRVITLSWQPSAGAENYTVKRATSPRGPFTTAAVVPEPTYVDRDVDHHGTYYYTISATNAAGRSPASETVSATPQPPA